MKTNNTISSEVKFTHFWAEADQEFSEVGANISDDSSHWNIKGKERVYKKRKSRKDIPFEDVWRTTVAFYNVLFVGIWGGGGRIAPRMWFGIPNIEISYVVYNTRFFYITKCQRMTCMICKDESCGYLETTSWWWGKPMKIQTFSLFLCSSMYTKYMERILFQSL